MRQVFNMSEYVLQLEHIAKSFFGIAALKDVSFGLEKGELLSLIGENGAGKSTLMNIVGGVLKADSGKLYLNGDPYEPQKPSDAAKAGIAFIHQELNLFTNLSIIDNMYIDSYPRIPGTPLIRKSAVADKVKEVLSSVDLDVPPETIVEKLSPGERQLVEIAKALSSDPQIFIFDEPTTSLTARETRKLFDIIERLLKEGKSIIYISHILADVQRLSDHIIVLRDGMITDRDKKENYTVNRMISSMIGREIDQLYPEKTNRPAKEPVLELKDISQKGITHKVSMKVYKGEVVGMFGLMGSGRSELARIVYGLDPYEEGKIFIHGREIRKISPRLAIKNKVAFVTENRREEGLFMDFTICDNLSLVSVPEKARTKLKIVDDSSVKQSTQDMVETLKIKCPPIGTNPAKSMSGGNQQKVVIGKWLLGSPDLLIVDEPTRGIDVGAKFEVYSIINKLASEGKGIWVISSELEELMGICDRIIIMGNGEVRGELKREEFDKEVIMKAAFNQNGKGDE